MATVAESEPGAIMGALPWPEAATRITAGHPIIIPIGAAAKAHGPHLPLATDKITVEALGEKLAAALPILVAPTVGFGYYPAFVEYPASQHISGRLFEDLLTTLMRSFIDHGGRRILLLNDGVSTEAPVTLACHSIYAETGIRPAMAHLRLFGRGADHVLDNPDGGHADERETSLMLALRPDLVDLTKAMPAPAEHPNGAPSSKPRPGGARIMQPIRLAHGRLAGPGEHSCDGATGDPTLASAEKGAAILAATMEDLIQEIRRVFHDAPGMANTAMANTGMANTGADGDSE